MNWKGLTSTFWAVDKITSFSDKDIDCITNTPLSNLRNLESNGINLHNAKRYRIFFHGHWQFMGQLKGKEGTIFIPLYHFHPLINIQTFPTHEHFQLCMWDDYHVFLIIPLVTNRLVLDVIYHLLELPFDWWWNVDFCLLDLILDFATAIW